MFNLFNNNQQSSGGYVSDYPPVIFTNSKQNSDNNINTNTNGNNNGYSQTFEQYNNQSPQQQGGFLSALFNSDIVKQILPMLLGGKLNAENQNISNMNILSLLKNISPKITNILKIFGNNKTIDKQISKVSSLDNTDNIIDMTNYEEIKD